MRTGVNIRDFYLSLPARRTIEYTGKIAFLGVIDMLWYNLLGASKIVARESFPAARASGLKLNFSPLVNGTQGNLCLPVLRNYFSDSDSRPTLSNFQVMFPNAMRNKGFTYFDMGVLIWAAAVVVMLGEPVSVLFNLTLNLFTTGRRNLNMDRSTVYTGFRMLAMPLFLSIAAASIIIQTPWEDVKHNTEILACMIGALVANDPSFTQKNAETADMKHAATAFLPVFISRPSVGLQFAAFLLVPPYLGVSSMVFEYYVTLGLAVKALYRGVVNPFSRNWCGNVWALRDAFFPPAGAAAPPLLPVAAPPNNNNGNPVIPDYGTAPAA